LIHIGLFEGIGGFSLAANWMGWKTVATCEINPFCQKVLNNYWPESYHHGDIHTLNYETINVELIKRFGTHWRNDDIIVTGGFP
jgi:DNA (cytosine-5)-methyltransferase 1